jgi:DNA ligase (NAD+)
MDKINRISNLVRELNEYRNEYYNLLTITTTVSDAEYDKLFDELQTLETETGIILFNSPTQQVGYTVVSNLKKVTHSVLLKSLDKTKSIDELKKWTKNKEILAMAKGDGLTVELIYNVGKLIQGSTRGNGEIGEDITHNIPSFKGVPLSIPHQGYLKIVGEAIIHKNDFQLINSKLPDDQKYATPRNLASGSVRQLDSKICAERNVYFYVFNVIETDYNLADSKYEIFKWLDTQGFYTIPNVKISNIDTLESIIEILKESARKMSLPIDGLVFSFDSRQYSSTLTETSHHPTHSIAYKFFDESESTTLTGIEWSLGKTGVITPVGLFKDVILDNTTVSRASLHNISILQDLELGIGDIINVVKCNMIIPQITDNLTRSNTIVIPTNCPACNAPTAINQDNDSKVLVCCNDYCSARFLKKLSHFVSRDAMNIEGLSEATLEKLINADIIHDSMSDIFNIENWKSLIIDMEGMGTKSYKKLFDSINKAKDTEMYRVIYSMSIPNIGRSASKAIAKYFDYDMDAFLCAVNDNFYFTAIEDFGDITHHSIYAWFAQHRDELIDVLAYVTIKKPQNKQSSNLKDLSGLTFCVTGTISSFKNRKELEDLILSLGGKLSSGVSSITKFLINNDLNSPSSKNQKAQQLNIPIISESDFNTMIGRIV